MPAPSALSRGGIAVRHLRGQLGIAGRLALMALILLTGFGLVTIWAAQNLIATETQRDREAAVKTIAAAFGPELARAHAEGDNARKAALMAQIDQIPGITGVDLREGLVRGPVGALEASTLVSAPGSDVPMTLAVRLDPTVVEGREASMLAPLSLLLGIFIVLGVPIYFFAVREALQPLQQLTNFAAQVTANRLSTAIDIKTGDEFETLGQAFNTMMSRLERSMRRIQRLAYVDPVTELPNAERFMQAVRVACAEQSTKGGIGAVLILRFARLREVLETVGDEASQDLLALLAQRLGTQVQTVDRSVRRERSRGHPAFLARLGSTDFAVLVRDLGDVAESQRFAQMLTAAFAQPFDWREHRFALGCVCGVALYPRDGRDGDTLMRHATVALGAARPGQQGLKFFTKSLDRAAVGKLTLEREMRAALEANQFRAYFQPKIDLRTGRIEGAEALARWIKPDGSVVSPAKFIPAAEQNDLIIPISEAILRQSVWKAAGWAREGRAIRVAVNVSTLQLRDERFPELVMGILRQAGLPAFCLELEITETIALEDPDRAQRLLAPLREQGVRVSIDDFGCGHSNLAALSRFPFDVVKIDQQFVFNLRKERHGGAMIEAILALARTMDLDVVAEGVETEEAAEFLRGRGCGYAQGFLYGPALPPGEFLQRLRQPTQAMAS